jgi:hypothetical protein
VNRKVCQYRRRHIGAAMAPGEKTVGSRIFVCYIPSVNRIAVNLSRAFLVLTIGWIAYTQTAEPPSHAHVDRNQ